jgi:hypothetical protein
LVEQAQRDNIKIRDLAERFVTAAVHQSRLLKLLPSLPPRRTLGVPLSGKSVVAGQRVAAVCMAPRSLGLHAEMGGRVAPR